MKLYLKFYKNLMRVRAFETLLVNFAKEGKFFQPICSGIGEEAGAVAISALMKKGDWLIPPSHRAFSYIINRGASIKMILAEMLGKRSGATPGLSGDRFVFPKLGIAGYSNSMGANFALAVGLGIAAKKRGGKKIVICVFGDGAASRGTFHGALNISALWKLPILWVCQNNQFSISARFSKICAVKNIADRAYGYNIKGLLIDGNDVLEIYENLKPIINSIRRGHQPVLAELKTFRVSNHYVGEIYWYLYQNKKEIAAWQKEDPILILSNKMKKIGISFLKAEKRIKLQVGKEIKLVRDDFIISEL